MKKYNFFAGPAILPQQVFETASKAILDFDGMGLSILEISHRSPQFQAVMDEAYALVKELLGLPEGYDVMFLQGGASSQFYMAPMNILGTNETAGYVDTGAWSTKSIKEAKRYGNLDVLASSKDKNYSYIPKGYDIPNNLKYLHITTNNTISGTQFHDVPNTDVKIVADMSSDIFSQPLDIDKYGLIYAGAQKNMGPAGTTLLVVDKAFATNSARDLPSMLDYNIHLSKQSSFNTPPVFAIYVSMLTMRWIKENGGVSAMEVRNNAKADLIYEEIDRNSLFYGTTSVEDRSKMSVTFKLKDEDLMPAFLDACADGGCMGVKGHRSVGGFRASIYNAMDIEGVQVLVDIMKSFEDQKG